MPINSPISAPQPVGPVASPRQLRWHGLEYYGFVHFSVNTFTDREWGYGDEPAALFNPTDFDAGHLAGVAATAGMSGLILTCKHHDGFCLWPSRYTEHSVKNSPWRAGRGDLVRELANACAGHGIGFGVYLSPWDRNHAAYGTPEYLTYYRNQLEELTSEYGPLFEVWFDGANGGDGYYGGARTTRTIDRRSYYDWDNTWQIVRRNQPNAVMFSDVGPDIRWVGNERGIAGDPCWPTITRHGLFPGMNENDLSTIRANSAMETAWASPQALLNRGEPTGGDWLPAECDVSIRPGWFYHSHEDDAVRSAENLLDLYLQSVGRGANLLLNLPPDRRGRIHERDQAALAAFRTQRTALFGPDLAAGMTISASNVRGVAGLTIESAAATRPQAADPAAAAAGAGAATAAPQRLPYGPGRLTDGDPSSYWATDDAVTTAEVIVRFDRPTTFTTISIREYLRLGSRVRGFAVDTDQDGRWIERFRGESIGARRIIHAAGERTLRIRLRITAATACPALSELAVYRAGNR